MHIHKETVHWFFFEKNGRYSKPITLDSTFHYYAFHKKDSTQLCLKEITPNWIYKTDTTYPNGLFQGKGYELKGGYEHSYIVIANYVLPESFYLFNEDNFLLGKGTLYPGNHYEFYKNVFRLRYYESFPITLFSYGKVHSKGSEIELILGNEIIEPQIKDEIPIIRFEGNFNNHSKKRDFILKVGNAQTVYLSSSEGYQKIKFLYYYEDCPVGF